MKKFAAFLLLFSLISFGGCGGGTDKAKNEVVLDWVGDKPGVWLDNGVSDFETNDEAMTCKPGEHDEEKKAIGASNPLKPPFSVGGKTKTIVVEKDETEYTTSDADYFAVELEGGVQYSLVFHEHNVELGADTGERALIFDPEVKIEHGGEELAYSLKTAEDAGAVILTFKPAKSGTHYVSVEAPELQELPYHFSVFEDADGTGMPVKYVNKDGYEFTFDDILYLRRLAREELATAENKLAAVGNAKEIWLATVNSFKPMTTGARGKIYLEPSILVARWDTQRDYGWGVNAVTGLDSDHKGIMPFTLKQVQAPQDTTQMTFVTSEREQSDIMNIKGSITMNIMGITIDAQGAFKNSIKYNETTTTIAIRYDFMEAMPSKLEPFQYSLDGLAMDYLKKQGHKAFRERYGDYFVAGARRGATYIATMTVKAKTSEKINEIKAKLKLIINGEFSKTFTEVTRDCQVSFYRMRIGSGPNPTAGFLGDNGEFDSNEPRFSADPVGVDQLMEDFVNFQKEIRRPGAMLVPREFFMYRYNQIPNVRDSFPLEIDVDENIFKQARELSLEIHGLTAANAAIADLPDDEDIKDGRDVKEKFNKSYIDVIDSIKKKRVEICSSPENLKAKTEELRKLKREQRDFVDRYTFYKKIMKLRDQWRTARELGNHGAESIGYDRYLQNSLIDADLQKGKSFSWEHSHKGYITERYYWWPEWGKGQGTPNHRIVYIWINSASEKDTNIDKNPPSIGNETLSWHFTSGAGKASKWFLKFRAFEPGANYPFDWDKF